MSCGLGRALGNLPLFPRSAFVFTKLSGLSWRQTLPSRQLLVPSLLRFSKASRLGVSSKCWDVGEDIALWLGSPGLSSPASAVLRDVPPPRISVLLLRGHLGHSQQLTHPWQPSGAAPALEGTFLTCPHRVYPLALVFWAPLRSAEEALGSPEPPLLPRRAPRASKHALKLGARLLLPGLCCDALGAASASCRGLSSISTPRCSQTWEIVHLCCRPPSSCFMQVSVIMCPALSSWRTVKNNSFCCIYCCVLRYAAPMG